MYNEFENYVNKPPEHYYIMTSDKEENEDWLRIDPIVTDHNIYAPKGEIAVFTESDSRSYAGSGNPLELICLACFYHLVRKGDQIRSSVIDGRYHVRIKPWRAPCETTAVYDDGINTYYLEGCKESGLFWRNFKESPNTVPPFVSCGALDTNAGCWYADCPHGYYFDDEEKPFKLM